MTTWGFILEMHSNIAMRQSGYILYVPSFSDQLRLGEGYFEG